MIRLREESERDIDENFEKWLSRRELCSFALLHRLRERWAIRSTNLIRKTKHQNTYKCVSVWRRLARVSSRRLVSSFASLIISIQLSSRPQFSCPVFCRPSEFPPPPQNESPNSASSLQSSSSPESPLLNVIVVIVLIVHFSRYPPLLSALRRVCKVLFICWLIFVRFCSDCLFSCCCANYISFRRLCTSRISSPLIGPPYALLAVSQIVLLRAVPASYILISHSSEKCVLR